ncbi:WD domain-containing protein [Coniochaeta sp. 2T2.1]|nr:WD domain-containing protein [Coniochaeta sp. 2T2.1]
MNDGQGTTNGATRVVTNGTRVSQHTSANGVSKNNSEGLNGSSQNGKAPARMPPGPYVGHDRGEMTRLLIQALSDMGYKDAAESVSKDSGIELESETVAAFRQAVLGGSWSRAEALLDGAVLSDEDQRKGNGLVLSTTADMDKMKFRLKQQKYLELLEQQDSARGLQVLRTELAPLCRDKTLHKLASLLMCQSPDDLKLKAEWDGAKGNSRNVLLSELSKNVSASVMLPEHRLATMLQQVKEHQLSTCKYHTDPEPPSLYADHYCPKDRFPSVVAYELKDHAGEVWQVEFSHDGSKMASCGKDNFVIIWSVPSFEVLHKLEAAPNFDLNHDSPGVGAVSWSPDDSMLVTCGRDPRDARSAKDGRGYCARVWDVASGTVSLEIQPFKEPVTSCAWAPDGQSFILGSMEKDQALVQWNLSGNRLYEWTTKHRVEDTAISPDGQWLVGMAYGNKILVFNYASREFEFDLELDARPTSISISRDSQFLLVNKENGEAKLIHLLSSEAPVKYKGHTGGLFQIRSAFGGANESYIISGSDEGRIFIWHKWTGRQTTVLEGHSPRTNGVSWNPADPCMFASCGDDGKIKIWSNPEFKRAADDARARSNGASANGNGRSSNGLQVPELEGEV